MSFKKGDIVELKSGGPEMTVVEVVKKIDDEPTGRIKCKWFSGKKLQNGSFPRESLAVADEEE